MPENARRFAAALYDQFEDEHRVADWGGDELFTRMPRPRAVDDAPAPRFRPALALVDPPEDRRDAPADRSDVPADRRGARARAPWDASRDRRDARPTAERDALRDGTGAGRPGRRGSQSPHEMVLARAERLGLSVVERPSEPPPAVRRWNDSGVTTEPPPAGRRTKVITGRPGSVPQPLPTVRAERPRPTRTPARWIGSRPERIVAWAFVLGLILVLIAISTADAAPL